MLARQVGGAGADGRTHERPQPGPHPGDLIAGDRPGRGRVERGVDRPEHVVDVVAGARRIVERTVVVGVGGADVGVGERAVGTRPPRHHEQAALVAGDRDDRGDVVAHQLPRDRHVDALGRPDRTTVSGALHRPQFVGPHPGGAHHHRGPDVEGTVAAGIDPGPGDRTVGAAVQRHHRATVGDGGAMIGGGLHERQHEAGVVDRGVVVEVAACDTIAVQRRQVGERRVGLEAPMQLADAPAAGEVVHPHRPAEGAGDAAGKQTVLRHDRDEERQDLDQVRGVVAEALAFA